MANSKINWWNILAWIGWIYWSLAIFFIIKNNNFSEFFDRLLKNESSFAFFFIPTAIWLWGTVRWLTIKFKNNNYEAPSFMKFILTNILAPIVVSVILHFLIGSSSITILSIPILGFLSASININ